MGNSRRTYLVLLLALSLLTWISSTGGAPVCCWGRSCSMMKMRMGGAQGCPMMSGSRTCTVSSRAALALPAPLIPVVPMPRRATGIPVLSLPSWPAAALLPSAAAGWPRGVFHPPQA